jgi:hypothetical protein
MKQNVFRSQLLWRIAFHKKLELFASLTYGPRMRLNDGRVIPAFIGQALRGEI